MGFSEWSHFRERRHESYLHSHPHRRVACIAECTPGGRITGARGKSGSDAGFLLGYGPLVFAHAKVRCLCAGGVGIPV